MNFGDADEPWIPTLWDIEAKKPDPYWSNFGWEVLEVPSDCVMVRDRMKDLKVRFDERYADRMLNQETMEVWQLRLQNRFDEVVRRYERAYRIYTDKEQQMMDDVEEGVHTTMKATSVSKAIDTPDSRINENSDYADSLNKGTADTDTKTVYTGTGLIKSINDSIDDWRDLDTKFVSEFENNFLNVYWY